MSFALTTEQVRARTKTVTRRIGWQFAKPGDVVQPVVKGQGLKKGETVEKIGGPIRFVRVDRVVLGDRADDSQTCPIQEWKFRCIGYDCEAPGYVAGTPESRCGCPDFVRPATLAGLRAAAPEPKK